MCIAAFCIHVVSLFIVSSEIANMNPLLSGFLHQSIDHISLNMFVLFIAMLNPINSKFDWKSIYIVTTVISLIYLPIEILGITPSAIGLSGTCYFFLTRSTINWGWIGKCVIFFLAISEAGSLFSGDSTAHGVHLIGIVLGIVSLHITEKQKSPELPGFFGI